MSGNTVFQDKLAITIRDKSIELQLGKSVFKLDMNEDGYVDFPESVRKELPTNIPEIAIVTVLGMTQDGRTQAEIDLEVIHQYWCSELMETGICDCSPVLWGSQEPDVDVQAGGCGSDGKLTCRVCGKSSTGHIHDGIHRYKDTILWDIIWTDDGHTTCYRVVSPTTLICQHCESKFWQSTWASVRRRQPNGPNQDIKEDRRTDGMVSGQGATEGQAGLPLSQD
jgi:hypothetical protein